MCVLLLLIIERYYYYYWLLLPAGKRGAYPAASAARARYSCCPQGQWQRRHVLLGSVPLDLDGDLGPPFSTRESMWMGCSFSLVSCLLLFVSCLSWLLPHLPESKLNRDLPDAA